MDKVLKSFFVLSSCAGIAHACNCREPKVEFKKDHSDVVFRGTIIELRDSDKAAGISAMWGRDTRKMAVFRVSRVWKGEVGQTFEMPAVEETSMCLGFLPDALMVGADLLIYADRVQVPGRESEYYTSICGFHKSARSAHDLRKLGRGEEPLKPRNPI